MEPSPSIFGPAILTGVLNELAESLKRYSRFLWE